MTLLWRGAFIQAHDHLEQGHLLYDSDHHHGHAFHYGNDPGVACLVHEALVLWVLGYPDRALAACHKAISLARHLGHPFSLTQALIYTIFVHQCRGEPRVIKNLTEEAKTLSIEHGFPFWLAEAGIMAGWAEAAQGSIEDGMIQMRNGITDFLATGARMDRPRWLALLAEAYGTNNQPEEGLKAVLSEALRVAEETKACLFQARLSRAQWRVAAQGWRAGRNGSRRSLLPSGAGRFAPPAGEVLGVMRGNEPGAPLAFARQTPRCP